MPISPKIRLEICRKNRWDPIGVHVIMVAPCMAGRSQAWQKKQGGKTMSARKRTIALVLAIALVCSAAVAALSARADAADI